MENKKKVNITVMESINDTELCILLESLKKLDGFNFLIDCQLVVSKA